MEYNQYKIDDIIEEISMGPFGSDIKKEVYTESGVPVLNGSNLQGFKLGEDSFGYVSEEKADSLKKSNAHRGDIIVTHRGTLGQMVYVHENSKYDRYLISQSQFRYRLKKDIARPDYVVYYFHTKEGQHKLLSNASQVGVPALARATTTFRQLEIPLPSLDIQNKVMNILLSLDAKIENNNKINANLEAQAAALFKSWFVDFEPFKDGGFVECELGMIPKGWKVASIKDFGEIICGKTPSKYEKEYYGGTIPFVKIPDMHGKVFVSLTGDSLSAKGSNSQIKKLIPANSLMVSCIATVGLIVINTRPSHTNQQINSVIPQKGDYLYYLYNELKRKTEYLQNLGRGGTATLNVNTSTFGNIKIIKPNDSLLHEYSKIVKPIFDVINKNDAENQRLSSLRDTLLPKLMSGEIDLDNWSKM